MTRSWFDTDVSSKHCPPARYLAFCALLSVPLTAPVYAACTLVATVANDSLTCDSGSGIRAPSISRGGWTGYCPCDMEDVNGAASFAIGPVRPWSWLGRVDQ